MLPASSVFDLGDETEQVDGSFKAITPFLNLALEGFLGKHDATMSTEVLLLLQKPVCGAQRALDAKR